MQYSQELKDLVGKRLAKHFVEGNSKADCVRKVFPKMNDNSCRTNAPTIFRRYKVVEHVLGMYSSTLGDKDCERLLNHLLDKAFQQNGNENLILQIIDRIAKLQGRYSEKIQVESRNLQEEEDRLKEAEAVLRRANVDPSKINLN